MNSYEQAWKTLKLMAQTQKKKWTAEELQKTMAEIEAISGITSA